MLTPLKNKEKEIYLAGVGKNELNEIANSIFIYKKKEWGKIKNLLENKNNKLKDKIEKLQLERQLLIGEKFKIKSKNITLVETPNLESNNKDMEKMELDISNLKDIIEQVKNGIDNPPQSLTEEDINKLKDLLKDEVKIETPRNHLEDKAEDIYEDALSEQEDNEYDNKNQLIDYASKSGESSESLSTYEADQISEEGKEKLFEELDNREEDEDQEFSTENDTGKYSSLEDNEEYQRILANLDRSDLLKGELEDYENDEESLYQKNEALATDKLIEEYNKKAIEESSKDVIEIKLYHIVLGIFLFLGIIYGIYRLITG